jgi:hypothetical protein
MKKNLKFGIIGAVVFTLIILGGYYFSNIRTKSYSPEDIVAYQHDDLQLEVFYNRPYKKGREIFGGLVPYDQVWRTGANEATTFQTNKDIMVDGSLLREKNPGKSFLIPKCIPGELR